MNRDSEHPTSVRCDACGREGDTSAARSTSSLSKVFVVVVACAACRAPFVVLSRN